jgi:hypothetical protein
MKYIFRRTHQKRTNHEFIEDVQRVARQLRKKTVTMTDYEELGMFHFATLIGRFGSWYKVLAAAGMPRTRWGHRIPEEDLFRNLNEVWKKLGRQPRNREMVPPLSVYSAITYQKRYGGWYNALEAFINHSQENKGFIRAEKGKFIKVKRRITRRSFRKPTSRLRLAVFERDHYRCVLCGRSPATENGVKLHCDHKVAWTKGGETVLSNLQTLCAECNFKKRDS